MRVAKRRGNPVFSKRSCSEIPAAMELQFFYGYSWVTGLEHGPERVQRLANGDKWWGSVCIVGDHAFLA
jgi:hypothetical protein